MQIIRRIGTHSGTFHADEVTGMMMLKNFVSEYQNAEIVRTRDAAVLASLDLIIDVGGEYDHERRRYDHHQKGFFETFSEQHKTKLSSAGLVFKHYGEEILRNTLTHIFDVEQLIDKKHGSELSAEDLGTLKNLLYNDFVEYVDGVDNGITQYPKEVMPRYKSQYTDLCSRISRLNNRSILKESLTQDQLFFKAMDLAKEDFVYEVTCKFVDKFIGHSIVKEAFSNRKNHHHSGKIMYIESSCSWKDALIKVERAEQADGEILFVLYHDKLDGNYRVQAVPQSQGSFELRRGLKEEWRGLRDEELEKANGIPGSVFCHINGFIGVGTSFESVLEMAKLSLPSL
jgi:uncharacterized UPF0160 family protein